MSETTTKQRRTKRRYAHELYPRAEEFEVRPLSVEVPFWYAAAIGLDVWGTGWSKAEPGEQADRIEQHVMAMHTALLADALAQGMTGDEAWVWASVANADLCAERLYERAKANGVDSDLIKPYPCGPALDHHDHYGPPDSRGSRQVFRIDGTEDECEACTEPAAASARFRVHPGDGTPGDGFDVRDGEEIVGWFETETAATEYADRLNGADRG